jgi:hypothetical protein
MAPIRSYLDEDAAFDPDVTRSMGEAFEAACKALKVVAADEQGQRVIATRIIDLARGGLTDAEALAERVIAEGKLSI